MSELSIIVTRNIPGQKLHEHFAPDWSAGLQVARWHKQKFPEADVTVYNKETGQREKIVLAGDVAAVAGTGEELETCGTCGSRFDYLMEQIAAKDVEISGLKMTVKTWTAKYAGLHDEKKAEAKDSPEHDEFLDAFEFWQRICKHPNAQPDLQRYKLFRIQRIKSGFELCLRAIAGAAHNGKQNKANGKKAYDDWETIFRNRGNFERCANAAPREWKTIYNIPEQE